MVFIATYKLLPACSHSTYTSRLL